MVTFETPLKKLKYLVLVEVAKLAKEGKVNKEELSRIPSEIIKGDKAKYRCCTFREKAIVLQRAKIIAGYAPEGEAMDDLVELEDDGQIIRVITSACDRCPVDKYTITEACRGCIQHKCMEVCPAQAISRIGGRSYINQDACKGCGMCSKACPYDAVAEVMRPCKRVCPTGAMDVSTVDPEDKVAMINNKDCINCGACMAVCGFGAITDRSYVVPVVRALEQKKKVYAVVAPAIAGQFGAKTTVGQIKDAFIKVGFSGLFEAACGADAVTVHEGNEFAERMENGDKYMTNSCCPGFLSYIEKKYPDQADRISGTVSPMVATARLIKEIDEDAVVVFVGPCTAKKSEILRPGIKGSVEYVLTFEEISAIMGAYGVDPETCDNIEIEDASSFGRGFAQGGGLTAAVQNYIKEKGVSVEFKPVKVSGPDEIKKAMMMAKAGRLDGNFIEGMMCDGGCIGGPATMVSFMKAKPQLAKYSSQASKKSVLSNDKLEQFKETNLER